MKELFTDVPEIVRAQARFWVEMGLRQRNPLDGLKMISEYANSCSNEEEKAFVDFYFHMRMEQLKNENNND